MRYFVRREFTSQIVTCARDITRIIVPIDRQFVGMPVKLKKFDSELHLIFKPKKKYGTITKPLDESTSRIQRCAEACGETCHRT